MKRRGFLGMLLTVAVAPFVAIKSMASTSKRQTAFWIVVKIFHDGKYDVSKNRFAFRVVDDRTRDGDLHPTAIAIASQKAEDFLMDYYIAHKIVGISHEAYLVNAPCNAKDESQDVVIKNEMVDLINPSRRFDEKLLVKVTGDPAYPDRLRKSTRPIRPWAARV